MDPGRLALFKRVFEAPIQGYRIQPIRAGENTCRVERVYFPPADGGSAPASIILKFGREQAEGPDHPAAREFQFYARYSHSLGPRLPQVYYNDLDPETGRLMLILEDLQPAFHFPPTSHRWTLEELQYALGAYARLHVEGEALLPDVSDRAWMFSYLDPPLDLDVVLMDYESLVRDAYWSPVDGLARLLEEAERSIRELAARPPTLLHHDVWPSNVALPRNDHQQAVLVDWEMAGWGPAEVDLAYLFQEPYQGARELSAAAVWDLYWKERQVMEGRIPPRAYRRSLQRQAEVLLALSLIRVARDVAQTPYPAESRPGAYWRVMHETLPARLRALAAENYR